MKTEFRGDHRKPLCEYSEDGIDTSEAALV
jgi:hypothetical protein